MSACEHAENISDEPILDDDGKPITATCQGCGWHGNIQHLTGCGLPEEQECTCTLWCPQCGTAGWIYD